ncbi:MAG TPA: TMEM175 family protein [Acidobacteriaceae bacterium]|jgi:uncharacterized membrane protein|nr:TMEM175 family protein [Acidobacteriaceae bacterium]
MQPKDLTEEATTQRLEAFSDGVFAIAITLLVLEIHVPNAANVYGAGGARLGSGLGGALLRLWPSYFGYVFSFLMVGIFWMNHHYIFKLYKRTDQMFLLLNVLFLMCISFLPLPTAILARWVTDAQQRNVAIVVYVLGLYLPAVMWLLMWLYATHHHRLVDKRLDKGFIDYLTRTFALSNGLYLVAVLLALWNGMAALVLCVGLSLLYLLPLKRPVYMVEEP